jgi:hypothetical protein
MLGGRCSLSLRVMMTLIAKQTWRGKNYLNDPFGRAWVGPQQVGVHSMSGWACELW